MPRFSFAASALNGNASQPTASFGTQGGNLEIWPLNGQGFDGLLLSGEAVIVPQVR
jgi:hypothetical protein